ncbi:MAG: Alginate regulatory protein AlgP [Polaromonas sp.]|nr:Alginate regulatory protein AlgP [Polaromonas sp.]
MSNSNTPSFPDFGKMVPGFDFLQNLAKQAAGSVTQATPQLPSLGSWIAPTLNVEELDKRVQELKAVQFWLDQNAVALKATIQALEVQKMTLSTLKGMNFNMGEVANAFKLKVSDSMANGMQRMTGKPDKAEKSDKDNKFPGLEIPPSAFQAGKEQADEEAEPAAKPSASSDQAAAAPSPVPSVADPMQWWGALTQQFQTIAAEAIKEVAKTTAMDATKSIASGMAKDAVKNATDMAKGMAETATKTMTGGARAAMNTALGGNWPKPAEEKAAPRKAAAKPAGKAATTSKPKSAAAKKSGAGTASARKTAR